MYVRLITRWRKPELKLSMLSERVSIVERTWWKLDGIRLVSLMSSAADINSYSVVSYPQRMEPLAWPMDQSRSEFQVTCLLSRCDSGVIKKEVSSWDKSRVEPLKSSLELGCCSSITPSCPSHFNDRNIACQCVIVTPTNNLLEQINPIWKRMHFEMKALHSFDLISINKTVTDLNECSDTDISWYLNQILLVILKEMGFNFV